MKIPLKGFRQHFPTEQRSIGSFCQMNFCWFRSYCAYWHTVIKFLEIIFIIGCFTKWRNSVSYVKKVTTWRQFYSILALVLFDLWLDPCKDLMGVPPVLLFTYPTMHFPILFKYSFFDCPTIPNINTRTFLKLAWSFHVQSELSRHSFRLISFLVHRKVFLTHERPSFRNKRQLLLLL